ncbi:MAG: Spo0E family sporulation regulatory protein-aspartic acid phosphatase [Clostridiaceae bacterium]|nr:Spo0E family sporulation regulatory protein-aspartic acid phosphatase [Clostridiaceae bacterium]
MSKDLMYCLITKMHFRLNQIIESNDFDLLNENVQQYSRRLDRVLTYYNRICINERTYDLCFYNVDSSTTTY